MLPRQTLRKSQIIHGASHPSSLAGHSRNPCIYIYIYIIYTHTHSVGDSESWAPSRPAEPQPAHVGSQSLRWDLIMLRHRRASTNTSSSLTFVGSSENVGRVPSPSPARSRHYQTPMSPECTMIPLSRTIQK